MRLVAWNCADKFASKVEALRSLRPDVAIVSEVRRNALAALPLDSTNVWTGHEGQRGLAILGFGEWRVSALSAPLGNWFVPFVGVAPGQELRGVGVWTETNVSISYQDLAEAAVGQIIAADTSPMVVAGDFNLSHSDDPNRLRNARIARVARDLENCGLRSAWHTQETEKFGQERVSTYYHGRKEAAGFHIDYMFFDHTRLKGVDRFAIGSYADWIASGLSDHAPLVADMRDEVLRA
jgi:hypothetical protein